VNTTQVDNLFCYVVVVVVVVVVKVVVADDAGDATVVDQAPDGRGGSRDSYIGWVPRPAGARVVSHERNYSRRTDPARTP